MNSGWPIRQDQNPLAAAEQRLEAEKLADGETTGAYVERQINAIFYRLAEMMGEGIIEAEHPWPIFHANVALINAWALYCAREEEPK